MKVAVLGVALLFSILLCLPDQSQAVMEGSGVICAGQIGGFGNGQSGVVGGFGGCIKKPSMPGGRKAEVQLLRE